MFCAQFITMASKHWIAGVVAAAVIGVGAWVYSGAGQTAAPQSTFVLLDGSQKTTADLKGKVTLVNFWATSCTTCCQCINASAARAGSVTAKFETAKVTP